MIDNILINKNIKRIDNIINSITKIKFQCKEISCKYIWETRPSHIINDNSGCPRCNKAGKNEKYIFNILKEKNIIFKHNFNIKNIDVNEEKNYRVDFYFPLNSLIIEYNGAQHYMPVKFGGISDVRAQVNFDKQIKRDNYVRGFCIKNNIKLIEIDGREFSNKKLKKYILEKIIINIGENYE